MTELEVAASKEHDGDVMAYVTEHIANGGTVLSMADAFTRASGIEITRNVLMNALRKLVPDCDVHLAAARKDSAHAIIETRRQEIEDLGGSATKEEAALHNLALRSDHWTAERYNRGDFGITDKTNVTFNVNLNRDLHLEVIKAGSSAAAKRLRNPGVEQDEIEVDPDANPEELI